MEKYRLVDEHKGDGDDFLESSTPSESEGTDTIVLKAMGRAINKAVTIAEILKRKMPLHQITALSSCEMIDVFEPLEEGLDVVTSRRYVSCVTIQLSRSGASMDSKDIGYQPPLPAEDITPGDLNAPAAAAAAAAGGAATGSASASSAAAGAGGKQQQQQHSHHHRHRHHHHEASLSQELGTAAAM